MNGTLKASLFVLFLSATMLSGTARVWAQDDNLSDEQAREAKTQESLNQIHDLESKIQDHGKKLDALEKAIDQLKVPEAPSQPIVEPKAVVPPVVSVQKATPVQKADPAPAAAFVPETSASNAPYVFRQPPVYFAPVTFQFKEHIFELSQDNFYSTFKESGDFQDYKKHGEFTGLYAAYTNRPTDLAYCPFDVFHLDAHGDYGYMDYNYNGDRVKDVNNYIVEPRLWAGRDFNFGSKVVITPYAGGGYRWYYDQLKNKTGDNAGAGGWNIQTQYVYIPVGAQLSVHPAEGWRLDMNGEYDFLAWGRVTNYLSNYESAASDINNTLSHGHGIKGSIKILKEEGRLNYFLEPYVSYWQIRASKGSEIFANGQPVVPYQEDKNSTLEIGARAGVDF
jgi:hypothetical protein